MTPRACSSRRFATTTPCFFSSTNFSTAASRKNCRTEDYTVPIGKAAVRREGRDLTIVSYAAMVHTSLEAAAELGEGRHRGRSDRPAHAAAAGSRNDSRVGAKRRTSCSWCTKTRAPAASPEKSRPWSWKMPSRIWTPRSAASLRSTRPCPTRRGLEDISCRTRRKLPRRRGNWHTTKRSGSWPVARDP